MNPVTQIPLTDLVCRLGVRTETVQRALSDTVQQLDQESHDPSVARTGRTPAQHLAISLTTPRAHAMVESIALRLEGREADARLLWEAYVLREITTATRAYEAVPKTALIGDAEAIRRIARGLGLYGDRTDQLIPSVVLMLAMGYYYRADADRHLTLVDILSRVVAEELTEMLRHAALMTAGRANEAAEVLRRFQQGPS